MTMNVSNLSGEPLQKNRNTSKRTTFLPLVLPHHGPSGLFIINLLCFQTSLSLPVWRNWRYDWGALCLSQQTYGEANSMRAAISSFIISIVISTPSTSSALKIRFLFPAGILGGKNGMVFAISARSKSITITF